MRARSHPLLLSQVYGAPHALHRENRLREHDFLFTEHEWELSLNPRASERGYEVPVINTQQQSLQFWLSLNTYHSISATSASGVLVLGTCESCCATSMLDTVPY